MSTKPHATRYPLKRETRIIDKGELEVIEVNLGLDLTEPNWADIDREVVLLSPKGLDGQRARMDPYKVIAQAQHLAELYRQYGKPIPNDLAVLLRVRYSKIDLDHFNIPPDNGCWVSQSYQQEEIRKLLEQLSLILKQGFKLLNSPRFSLKDMIMLPTRQPHEISETIVVFDAIEMMNNPAFRKWFTMRNLPNQPMFHNITSLIGSGVIRLVNIDIAFAVFPTPTFPSMMILTWSEEGRKYLARIPSIFHGTGSASTTCGSRGLLRPDCFPTIDTKGWLPLFSSGLPCIGNCTVAASYGFGTNEGATIDTRMKMGFMPFQPSEILFGLHNAIVTWSQLDVKQGIPQVQGTCLECPRETCIEDEPPVVKGRLPHMESVARRDAVLRRYVSGESVTAISKAMAVKYNTVASIISKARKRKEGCVSIIK